MSDLISRQAMFDTAAEYEKELCEILGDENELVEVVKILKHRLISLPSAQPEPCEDAISRADAIRVASGYCHPVNVAQELAKLPSVQPELKWISVTKRLPEEAEARYWVCTDGGYQCQCRWTNDVFGLGEGDEWTWKIFDIPQYSKVIAWMPLPEPYREEGEKEDEFTD